jgi:hypothetical protein
LIIYITSTALLMIEELAGAWRWRCPHVVLKVAWLDSGFISGDNKDSVVGWLQKAGVEVGYVERSLKVFLNTSTSPEISADERRVPCCVAFRVTCYDALMPMLRKWRHFKLPSEATLNNILLS